MTEWRAVPGFETSYEVSADGQVRSLPGPYRAGRLLKPTLRPNGYLTVTLCKNGTEKTVKVHRLVALAFIDNPEDYPIIDHINGDKLDNSVANLRWCTHAMNIHNPITFARQQAAFAEVVKTPEWKAKNKEALKKASAACSIPVVCIETGVWYGSASEASNDVGITRANISKSCYRYQAGNTDTISSYRGKPVYHFRFATEAENAEHQAA